jgi:transcription initiation factor IIF auxiliary subunit
MQGFTHSRYFPLIVLSVIAVLAMIALQFYPSDSTQTKNTDPTETYSFEAPGQLKNQTHDNAFSSKSAEELQESASDIMKRADAIIAANPIESVPMTQEQQQEIENTVSELDKKIEQLDQQIQKIKSQN